MTKPTHKAAAAPKTKTDQTGHVAKRGGQSVALSLAASGPVPGGGFLAKTRLKKAGGSLVMTVPAAARNLLHLTEGQEVAVSVKGSKVVIEPMRGAMLRPVRQPKYTLDELVAGMNSDAPLTDEERAWMDGPPAGREIW